MNSSHPPNDRLRLLIAELIDGQLTTADGAELNRLLLADPHSASHVVDQLILDSLLSEELGTESLTALVDLAGQSPADESCSVESHPDKPPAGESPSAESPVGPWSRTWRAMGQVFSARRTWHVAGVLAVVAVIGLAFVMGRWERSSFASSSEVIVRAAIDAHAGPVERVYVVQTERSAAGVAGFKPPRDVRVTTQGDRFFVEMNRGERSWHWGLDPDGSIWLTLGARRAIVINREELGPALHHISSLYTLNVETLLQDLCKHCSLEYKEGTEGTHFITATAKRRWNGAGLRKATIEVDRETKAVRRLEIHRDIPFQGASTVTFTLVDSRAPDESKYRPQGHLVAPYRLLNRDTRLDLRRELLANWFGPLAERWLKAPEAKSP